MKLLLLITALLTTALAQVKVRNFDLLDNSNDPNKTAPFSATGRAGRVIEVLGSIEIGDADGGKYFSNGVEWVRFNNLYDDTEINDRVEDLELRVNRVATIFILAGQSNMAGNPTGWNGVLLPQDYPLGNMFQLSRGHQFDLYGDVSEGEAGDIIPAMQPLQVSDIPINDAVGIGLGFYFAYHYAIEHPNEDVIIVQSSVGSTGFSSGEWVAGTGSLYQDMITQTRTAVDYAVGNYESVNLIQGWHQGERDAGDAVNYLSNFTALVDGFRAEFANVDNEIPLVLGTLTHVTDHEINYVLEDVPLTVSNSVTAELSGLDSGGTNHFTAESYRVAGKRYYQSYKEAFGGGVDLINFDEEVKASLNASVLNHEGEAVLSSEIGDLTIEADKLVRNYQFSHNRDELRLGSESVIQAGNLSGGDLVMLNNGNFFATDYTPNDNENFTIMFKIKHSRNSTIHFWLDAGAPLRVFWNGDDLFFNSATSNGAELKVNLGDDEWHVVVAHYEVSTGAVTLAVDGVVDSAFVPIGVVSYSSPIYYGRGRNGNSFLNIQGLIERTDKLVIWEGADFTEEDLISISLRN